MEYVIDSQTQKCDLSFAKQVREESGVDFNRCYQCLTCSLSCPVSFAMDFYPNQIIRLVQLGLKDAVLKSSTIWLCASCESCVARCPNEIDIPKLMDTLHQIALREGVTPKEPAVATFHKTFLDPIKRFGREYEAMMAALFIIRSRKFSLSDLIDNASLGLEMFTKGKLKLSPPSIKGKKEIREIFKKSERRA